MAEKLMGALRQWGRDTRIISVIVSSGLVIAALVYSSPDPGTASSGSLSGQGLPGQVGSIVDSITGSAAVEPGYPRIRVPRVGINLLLVKGDGKTPPVRAEAFTYPTADHLLTTAVPGGGNTYIYSHARTHMFWELHDLRIGDVVEIDYGGGKVLRYRVSEIHTRVDWRDFSWTQPTTDDRVTLQTCNGWQDSDPRFVVVARRIPDSTA
ncbi:MAG TPA: sortase [Candidatus Dormibacteraeota bacterium]|jgi:LPXTG-site transpeptidase (sortase) family protein|nr:sortase [Candidatus Dormibacteraeota bacterium]